MGDRRALTEEFFAGDGRARPGNRTLFVVGDEKQSIYCFQGADLEPTSAACGRGWRSAPPPRRLAFARETLDLSFRSSRAVLEVVDACSTSPTWRPASTLGETVRHDTAARPAGPGRGLAARHPAEDEREPPSWPLPDRPRVADEPERRVAAAIAGRIRELAEQGEQIETEQGRRRVRAGDILVLVQRRGRIQELIIRALKRDGVPVAGADRLPFGEHIVFKDLVALGRAMLLPEDDLTLACLLKSPLVGLDEDQLFALAWDRDKASLFERLRERAQAPGTFADGYERLAALDARRPTSCRRSSSTPSLLGAGGGRKRLLARLGPDAAEPIEAFLARCWPTSAAIRRRSRASCTGSSSAARTSSATPSRRATPSG